jgi:hypothetical protein
VLCSGWAQETGQNVRTEKGRALHSMLSMAMKHHIVLIQWCYGHSGIKHVLWWLPDLLYR